jgi:hypothetical protein
MSEENRKNLNRVNFFDGQRVTEIDLDDEQYYFLNKINNIAVDFHSSGILDSDKLNRRILLDTSAPGLYGENSSATVISAGQYDGRGITLDVQPSDSSYGNKLEVELFGSEARGRDKVKVLIIGKVFNSLEQGGDLVVELLEFSANQTRLTKNYFTRINAIIFNNFSGGSGINEYGNLEYKSLGSNGKLIIREASPLKVFPNSLNIESTQTPNFKLSEFGSSSIGRTLKEEIGLTLTSEDVLGDLFLDFEIKETIKFEENASISKAYGQKFLNKSNNIQSVELYMGIEGSDNWTGDLVFSIYELATEIESRNAENYDRLIDFDPELTPIAEVSYDRETLEDLGYKITARPTLVSFDFSGSFLANPNMSPDLSKDKFYCFMISRRGDNSVGNILLYKGYDLVTRKNELSKPLNPVDKYGRQESRFIEFDPNVKRYIDDYTSSLWFRVNSSSVEITDGIFYSDSGAAIVLPKTEEYVGSSIISKSYLNFDLRDLSSGAKNYVVIEEKKTFVDADVHPRTGNFIFTRIQDAASINVYNEQEYRSLGSLKSVVLSRVIDSNLRSNEFSEGTFDLPGLINENYFYIINPDSSLIKKDLIGKNFVPDTECQCSNTYKIVDVECITSYLGDLNGSGKIDSDDIIRAIDIAGNSLGSESTDMKILGGEIDVIDFYKSDVNNDGTVDGIDIDLLEKAINGDVNFSKPYKFNILKVYIESLFEEGNKTIFLDSNNSSVATSSSNQIQITLDDYRKGLMVGIGDKVVISEGSSDDGTYIISSKSFDASTLILNIEVVSLDGADVSFSGVSSGNFEIISYSDTNTFVDNIDLLSIPYQSKAFSIYQSYNSFLEEKIEICDLRRYVEFSFVETEDISCICIEDDCVIEEECDPKTKNQKFLPNDLIISGDILGEDRLPYHGDYEFSTISFPLPPGDVVDCNLDLYNIFVKSDGQNCNTSYGYPAMKFSDGTYVGCEDTPSSNDITKNRVKFIDAIASLYVASQTESSSSIVLNESFNQYITTYSNDYYYDQFSLWTEDPLNSSSGISIQKTSNNVSFELVTVESSGLRFARLEAPSESEPLEGDFLVDARIARTEWDDDSISFGTVRSGLRVLVSNDSGTSEVKIGFSKNGSNSSKYFYSLAMYDNESVIVDEYYFEKDIEDDLNEDVIFRLRRINDSIQGYHISPDNISFLDDTDQQFKKISGRMFRHAGYGNATVSIFMEQDRAPSAAQTFSSVFRKVTIKDNLESEERLNEIITLSRNQSTALTQSSLVTFPLNIGSTVVLNSATLTFTARSSLPSSSTIEIKKVKSVNLDNLDPYYNYHVDTGISTTIGPVAEGESVSISVLNVIADYLSEIGHLPGFNKGFYINIATDEDAAINLNPNDFRLNISYTNTSLGETFKVGLDLDKSTGVLSISTKNILYDFSDPKDRTVVKVGVLLKKKGFINKDVELTLVELNSLGIGDCSGEENFVLPGVVSVDGCESYFISGMTMPGSPVGGSYSSNLHVGIDNCVESVTDGVATLSSESVTDTEDTSEPEVPEENVDTPEVVEPEAEITEEDPWSPKLIKNSILAWYDLGDESKITSEESVVPQKVSNQDFNLYKLATRIEDSSNKNRPLTFNEEVLSNDVRRLTSAPVLVRDAYLDKSFLRFDGVNNYMEIFNANEQNVDGVNENGLSVFLAASFREPSKKYGTANSFLRESLRYSKKSVIISKGAGNGSTSDFSLQLLGYNSNINTSFKSNTISYFKDDESKAAISNMVEYGKLGLYSFKTNKSTPIGDQESFHKDGTSFPYQKNVGYDELQPLGSSPTSSPIYLGGLPIIDEDASGIKNGLNLSADIYEVIMVSGEVGTLTRQTIEGYLAHKYNAADLLPEAHPFKNDRPTLSNGSYVVNS